MKNTALFIAALALILAACAPAATPAPVAPAVTEAPAAVEATTAPAAAAPVHVAFFVPWTEDVWYVVAIKAAKDRAAQLGIELDVFDGGNKVEQQLQQFDNALVAKPDAIVLSSVDPATMVPSIEKASAQGIKTVVYDRPIFATTKLDALLVLDTPNMGEMQGQAIVDYLTQKNGSAKGKVIRVYGDLADTWVTGISEGWDPFMAKYPDIKVLQAMSGAWAPDQASANVEQLLTANPDVDAIVMDSDWLASGIITYLKSHYDPVGGGNHIFVIGDGGMPEGLQYIRDGYMDMTINNPVPDFVGAAIEVAYKLANGETLPDQWVEEGKPWSPAPITMNAPTTDKPYAGPVVNMGNFIVDKTNVDDPTLWGNMANQP